MRRRLDLVLVRIPLALAMIAAVGESNAQQKAPVPDGAVLEASQKAADELFGGRFRSAKTAADKTAVAADMIEAALQLQSGSPDQYALLKIARQIAAGAGDAATALQAAEQQAERFDMPSAKLKAETLLVAAREATTTAQHKAVAEAAPPVVGSLADAGEIELALDVCEAGRSAAQKSRQIALVKEFAAKADALKKQQASLQQYRQALAVMQDDPVEPAANLAAGRYLCFVAGDWERGVPYLALGSDESLKAVAVKELRRAGSADEQAAIGDMWWALAETRRGSERDALLVRAGAWYRQAEPRLAGGLAGLKVKQRLAEVAQLGRQIPKLSRTATSLPPPPLAIAPFDEKTAKQLQAAWAAHLSVPVVQTNSIGTKLVLIPPGELNMGSTPEEVAELIAEGRRQKTHDWHLSRVASEAPRHRVQITKPFYLGLCEVTQKEYEQVMGKNPSEFTSDSNRPVERVSWNEANEFCRKLSEFPAEEAAGAVYRLPTEAEWEYACRAGTATRFVFGDEPVGMDRHAWWRSNSQGSTQPVGRLQPNAWALLDMHGNVWEWCADWWAADYYANSPAADPAGPDSGSDRVLRGGAWKYDNPLNFRCAFRNHELPVNRFHDNGFRVARSLAP